MKQNHDETFFMGFVSTLFKYTIYRSCKPLFWMYGMSQDIPY